MYLVLCSRLEIGLSPGDGCGGRLGQSFCVGYKGRYSLLSNKRGAWNKRGGVTNFEIEKCGGLQ